MKVVNKKKFLKSITILAILIFSISLFFSKAFASKEEVKVEESTYIVSKGETLWSIAKKYKLDNQDTRDYIYKIEKLNNMSSATIYEGQELKIFIYEEAE